MEEKTVQLFIQRCKPYLVGVAYYPYPIGESSYDSKKEIINLGIESDDMRIVLATAAHECAHAWQHMSRYLPFMLCRFQWPILGFIPQMLLYLVERDATEHAKASLHTEVVYNRISALDYKVCVEWLDSQLETYNPLKFLKK